MKPTTEEITAAIVTIQSAMSAYRNKETVDGPVILIRPAGIEVIDCHGIYLENDNRPNIAAQCFDLLD